MYVVVSQWYYYTDVELFYDTLLVLLFAACTPANVQHTELEEYAGHLHYTSHNIAATISYKCSYYHR